jgi:hypothetical protein
MGSAKAAPELKKMVSLRLPAKPSAVIKIYDISNSTFDRPGDDLSRAHKNCGD